MPRLREDALSGVPAPLRDAVSLCAGGEISANVALMRLLMLSADAEQARDALTRVQESLAEHGDAAAGSRVDSLAQLWAETPDAWDTIRGVLGCLPDERWPVASESAVARWAQAFDQAAEASDDASVALYALGRADLLEATTSEVIAALRRCKALTASQSILEIGCGTGRFIERLAPAAELAVGIDVSAGMLRRARSRCHDLKHASFVQTTGRDLAVFSDASFDLVLAIDSFPYIVSAGGDLAQTCAAETARVLKPKGRFLILNYSYRGSPDLDDRDVARAALHHRFSILRNGTRDLSLWDARTYLLQRS